MHPVITAKLALLEALCRKHHVLRLELFGSAAADNFDPSRSDLDFVVEFLPVERHGLKDVYFDLLEDLERLFARPVDLIERSAIRNPYFRASVDATKVPLYAAA
jgi:predicted nucleotidyltransferase